MTAKAKQTPGPWKMVLKNRLTPTIESKGRYIAKTITYGDVENKENWDIANARLIAAAPELLATLIALVDHAQEQESNFNYQRGQTEIDAGIKAAEKAIGKKWTNIKTEDK